MPAEISVCEIVTMPIACSERRRHGSRLHSGTS